ncbi:MAG TPA: hypothetical protein PKC43_12500 [Phycisphaerales bacterium]|nr:hypothetical protein [Phycisphaerales bacterium]HMP38253.1 hypothetical protein [Phycisphaerales bacterium]
MAKKTRGRRGRKPAGASGNALQTLSIGELQAEISRRQRGATAIVKRRERLAAKLAEIDRHLVSLGIEPGSAAPRRGPGRPRGSGAAARPAAAAVARRGKRGRRPKNGQSLVDALHKVMTGKTLGVAEAAKAVLDEGYKTKSSNFRTVVNQTLLVNKDRFKKVERGRYTAK